MKRAFDQRRPTVAKSDTLTPEELEAAALDDRKLHGYKHDEREIQVFQDLRYSGEQQQWLARFRIVAHPDHPFMELTHSEVLSAGRTLLAMGTKPSQCLRASRALSAKINGAT
jgi:hypothetical protein